MQRKLALLSLIIDEFQSFKIIPRLVIFQSNLIDNVYIVYFFDQSR